MRMHTKPWYIRSNSLVPLITLIGLTACAGSGLFYETVLTEPEPDRVLVIGAVIVGSVNEQKPKNPIEVYIVADVEEEGETVRKGFTVFPDDQGYFALENMPSGQYALKGAQYGLVDVPAGLIWHEMRYPTDRWHTRGWTTLPPFTGNLPPSNTMTDVINLGYNVFILTSGGDVRHHYRDQINNESFDLPYTFRNPRIEAYFIQRFPQSGWVPVLKQSLPPSS